MKIKCIKIYNPITKEPQEKSSWVTIGKEYVVLEIIVAPHEEVLYRMVGDTVNGMPALYEARQFKVISDKIPPNWVIEDSDGELTFCPKAWCVPGFWERCYDQDPDALAVYREEVGKIYAFEDSE